MIAERINVRTARISIASFFSRWTTIFNSAISFRDRHLLIDFMLLFRPIWQKGLYPWWKGRERSVNSITKQLSDETQTYLDGISFLRGLLNKPRSSIWSTNKYGQLTFKEHIAKTARSCRFALHNIRKIRPFLTKHAAQLLVQALVISRLDYCNALLAGLPSNTIKPLQMIQNAAARLVFNEPKRAHVTPLFVSLHWLPVAARIQFKTLMLAYRTTTGSAPTYFHSLLRIDIPSRSLRSASERRLVVPSQRGSKSLSRTFSFTVPGWWNDLPTPIRNAGSLSNLSLLSCLNRLFRMIYNHWMGSMGFKVSTWWVFVHPKWKRWCVSGCIIGGHLSQLWPITDRLQPSKFNPNYLIWSICPITFLIGSLISSCCNLWRKYKRKAIVLIKNICLVISGSVILNHVWDKMNKKYPRAPKSAFWWCVSKTFKGWTETPLTFKHFFSTHVICFDILYDWIILIQAET